MAARLVLVSVIAACGGTSGTPPKPPVANTTEAVQSQPRDQVVNDALVALANGNVEKLMELADTKGLYEKGIQCKSDGRDDDYGTDMKDLDRKLRRDFAAATEKAKGSSVEVVSIKNEVKSWTSAGSRYGARNANFVAKGGTVSKDCSARTDLVFHEVEVRIRVKKGGAADPGGEQRVSVDLVHAGTRWYLLKVPRDLGSGATDALAMMEKFSNAMCQCKDKACADKVNDEMAKWGTEMAKSARYDYDERPDPDMARKSADIMTKYTECMTKLMMMGAGTP